MVIYDYYWHHTMSKNDHYCCTTRSNLTEKPFTRHGSSFTLLRGLGHPDNHAAPGKRSSVWSDVVGLPCAMSQRRTNQIQSCMHVVSVTWPFWRGFPSQAHSPLLLPSVQGKWHKLSITIDRLPPQKQEPVWTLREGPLQKGYLKRRACIWRRVRHVIFL